MTLCPTSDPGQVESGTEKAMSRGRNLEPGLEGLSGGRREALGSGEHSLDGPSASACQPFSHAHTTCTPCPTHPAPQRPCALNVWLGF